MTHFVGLAFNDVTEGGGGFGGFLEHNFRRALNGKGSRSRDFGLEGQLEGLCREMVLGGLIKRLRGHRTPPDGID